MSKFNNVFEKYIKEQNINFNSDAAKTTTVPENPQLDKAADVMEVVKNLIQGQVKQTPEEFEKALISALTPFGAKTADEAHKLVADYLEKIGYKKQDQQNNLNTTTQDKTQEETPKQPTPNTPKTTDTALASMPKA